jgi:hypothetical protein
MTKMGNVGTTKIDHIRRTLHYEEGHLSMSFSMEELCVTRTVNGVPIQTGRWLWNVER